MRDFQTGGSAAGGWDSSYRPGTVLANPAAAYLLLGLLWALARAFPLSQCVPATYWEVWEARKLLDYGFLERHGAIIDNHFMVGKVAHPEAFNYVNHPYPPLWVATAIYAAVGEWGVIAANALLGLGCGLLALFVLRRRFDPVAAWSGAALGVLAPASIFFDCDTHEVAMGASFWPLLFLAADSCARGERRWRAWRLGICTFLAVQASWFTLSMLPTLLVWTRGAGSVAGRPRGGMFLSRGQVALLAGAAAATGLFALQIVVYSPGLGDIRSYAAAQCNFGAAEMSRLVMFRGIALRATMMVGPALLLGGAAGLLRRGVGPPGARENQGFFAYFGVWAMAAVLLTRFFYRERAMYEYLVFPAAFLVAGFLHEGRSRWLSRLLPILGLVGALYPQMQATIPVVSETSQSLGRFVGGRTRPEELVLTNMVGQRFPFGSWDVGSLFTVSLVADRLVREGIEGASELSGALQPFRGSLPDAVFLYDPSRPLSPSFLEELRRASTEVQVATIEMVPQPVSLAGRLRYLFWRGHGQFGSGAAIEGEAANRALRVEVYRLPGERLARWASGGA